MRIALICSLSLLLLSSLLPPGFATRLERVSVNSRGTQGNLDSGSPFPAEFAGVAMSADGQCVAFFSEANNLVAGDSNGRKDLFVRIIGSSQTVRVSVSTTGGQVHRTIEGPPGISAQGRFITFTSYDVLVPDDLNGSADVYVRDLLTRQTTLVSRNTTGFAANGHSGQTGQAMSADGKHVAFASEAWDLVPGDTNWRDDIFVRDLTTSSTRRVSVATGGGQSNGSIIGNWGPAISADGSVIAFSSDSTNLVLGDTSSTFDVFVHDRRTGQTTRVSVDSFGAEANDHSAFFKAGAPAISADGRYVAFCSLASNLVPGDTNGMQDIFVHDRQTGSTTRVSVSTAGAQGNDWSGNINPSISGDGRFVAFASMASNLVAGDSNGSLDVFIHDRLTGMTARASVGVGLNQGSHWSGRSLSLSHDGSSIAFDSAADNLIPGDSNGKTDVFVRDL